MNDRVFIGFGVLVLVALVCFTILAALHANGLDTMRDVLIGLVAGLTGGYAVARKRNGNGKT